MSALAPQTEAATTPLAERKRFPRLLRFFEPAPAVPLVVTDPELTDVKHRYWERRIIIATILGYATYYFVRKNLSIAMPVMEKSLGITKVDLGLFLTLHGVLYGVSKFVNGFFGDRCHVRTFMVTGLVLSAIVNVFFGLSSAVAALGIFWMINGWFQGMGFPPCVKRFKDENQLPYPLLSDADGKVADQYGGRIPVVGVANRATYVVGADGIVKEIVTGGAAIDPNSAIAACPMHQKG